jgi:hypothetical protein
MLMEYFFEVVDRALIDKPGRILSLVSTPCSIHDDVQRAAPTAPRVRVSRTGCAAHLASTNPDHDEW